MPNTNAVFLALKTFQRWTMPNLNTWGFYKKTVSNYWRICFWVLYWVHWTATLITWVRFSLSKVFPWCSRYVSSEISTFPSFTSISSDVYHGDLATSPKLTSISEGSPQLLDDANLTWWCGRIQGITGSWAKKRTERCAAVQSHTQGTVARARGSKRVECNIGFLEAPGTTLTHLKRGHDISTGSPVIVGSTSSSRKSALIKMTDD